MGHPVPSGITRLERFGLVSSTQDVVRGWLADGQAEICVAVADEQTAGRGRFERRWLAPPGRALLLSAGFRPAWLAPARAWRLTASAALAMLEAAVAMLGPGADRLALKWPNDIVAVRDGDLRKVGGLLAEGELDGVRLRSVAIGLGVNVDWPPSDFLMELVPAMGSLSEAAAAPVDREALLAGWLARMVSSYVALAADDFDTGRWAEAQVTTGAQVVVETGGLQLEGCAEGVDPDSGALLVREAATGVLRHVAAGEVLRCRVVGSASTL